MSNAQVDAQVLNRFLQRLGQCYRRPGTLYLVGGSSLLLVAAKASTFDIDITFEVAPEDHAEFIRCVRQVSREIEVPVEQTSPAEFLPLPFGYRDRRRYIGRYGSLEVFHFDLYSVALSKLLRASDKDLQDVVALVRSGAIERTKLERYFQEILPKIENYSLRADPQDFERRYRLFENILFDDWT